MADMTMCQNQFCPLNDKCKRYLAVPNDLWQSYFNPMTVPSDNCEYFIEATKEEKKRYYEIKQKLYSEYLDRVGGNNE